MSFVFCKKYQKKLPALIQAPMPGELGTFILQNISQKAWVEWQKQQTILINEHRLRLFEASAQQFLQEQMQRFLLLSRWTWATSRNKEMPVVCIGTDIVQISRITRLHSRWQLGFAEKILTEKELHQFILCCQPPVFWPNALLPKKPV